MISIRSLLLYISNFEAVGTPIEFYRTILLKNMLQKIKIHKVVLFEARLQYTEK